jgi:hypothetical protein
MLCLFCAVILSAQNPADAEWDDIHFETGSSVLVEGFSILTRLALLLKDRPDSEATLTGYADREGSPALNQRLSLARAAAVRDFLVQEGARLSQIVVKAQGEDDPVAANNTKEGRFRNRRVTIKLKGPLILEGGVSDVARTLNELLDFNKRQADLGAQTNQKLNKLDDLMAANARLASELAELQNKVASLSTLQGAPPPIPLQAAAGQPIKPPPATAHAPAASGWQGGFTKRDLLIGPAPESKGYGLYSYLLLPRQPAPAEIDLTQRYLSTLDAFIALNSIASLKDEPAPPPPAKINITYLPVLRAPSKVVAADLFQDYNYGSAHDSLLPRLRNAHPAVDSSDGPFIVSVTRPLLSLDQAPANHLFFDLSGVPPRVVSLYIRAFLTQAGKERFWEKNRQAWLLDCYSMIEVAGDVLSDAEKPYTKKAFLATISGWFGR